MKILITYYSQSGNTEKLANAVFEEVSKNNETDFKKLEDLKSEDYAGYDFIFIGSPLHSGSLAKPVINKLKEIKPGTGQKMAGLITHFSPAYPEQDMKKFAEPMEEICKEMKIEYKGCYDCQGALIESMHEFVKKKINASDEEWKEIVKKMAGHPDKEDLLKGVEFAKKVLE